MTTVGIDLGIHKIALFCVTRGHEDAWAYQATSPLRDEQLAELGAMAHDFALMHEAEWVWIEDTIIGNNRKYSIGLAETKGAVMSDLSQLRHQQGLDVRLVDNKVWKKEVLGHGNASKVEVRDYIQDTHPDYAPLCGEDEDLYDACAIGLYGDLVLDRARDLQL